MEAHLNKVMNGLTDESYQTRVLQEHNSVFHLGAKVQCSLILGSQQLYRA